MRRMLVASTCCSVAFAVAAVTARPGAGVLAGLFLALAASRIWADDHRVGVAPRHAAPRWVVTVLSFLPVAAFLILLGGVDGATDAMPHAGWRAVAVVGLMLAYVRGLEEFGPGEAESPAPDLRGSIPAAVRREIDDATRGR